MLQWIKDRLKRPLPTGMTEFNNLVDDVVRCSTLPNNNSTRTLVAEFICLTPPQLKSISVVALARELQRKASYQVANAALKEIHLERIEEAKPKAP